MFWRFIKPRCFSSSTSHYNLERNYNFSAWAPGALEAPEIPGLPSGAPGVMEGLGSPEAPLASGRCTGGSRGILEALGGRIEALKAREAPESAGGAGGNRGARVHQRR